MLKSKKKGLLKRKKLSKKIDYNKNKSFVKLLKKHNEIKIINIRLPIQKLVFCDGLHVFEKFSKDIINKSGDDLKLNKDILIKIREKQVKFDKVATSNLISDMNTSLEHYIRFIQGKDELKLNNEMAYLFIKLNYILYGKKYIEVKDNFYSNVPYLISMMDKWTMFKNQQILLTTVVPNQNTQKNMNLNYYRLIEKNKSNWTILLVLPKGAKIHDNLGNIDLETNIDKLKCRITKAELQLIIYLIYIYSHELLYVGNHCESEIYLIKKKDFDMNKPIKYIMIGTSENLAFFGIKLLHLLKENYIKYKNNNITVSNGDLKTYLKIMNNDKNFKDFIKMLYSF